MIRAITIVKSNAILMFMSLTAALAQSPGDTVGTTMLVYQSNGPSGNRIRLDNSEGVHFTWTKALGYSNRYVYYNYMDADGNWLTEDGTEIGGGNGSGYCQIELTGDSRAAIAFHNYQNYVLLAEDLFSGFGIFGMFDPPDMIRFRCFWPYLAIARNGDIHLVMLENTPNAGDPAILGYTKSKTGGNEWSGLQAVDTLLYPSYIIAASPVSDKVAIAYAHPLSRFNSQVKSDIYYIESNNGMIWDWNEGKINVTQYGRLGDSLFAHTDLDIIYDYNDNLHLIWNANWISSEEISNLNFLYHFDSGSGMVSLVDSIDIDLSYCESPLFTRPVSKMTFGVQEATGALFTVYTRLDPDDCSSSGHSNGDLFLQTSLDNGSSWSAPENITNSRSPDCLPGECYSDLSPSLADRVTNYMHISYVVDKAGGGYWEGLNPVLYLRLPVPLAGNDPGGSIPESFSLAQNYPNPFNATTAIEFELFEDSDVNLAVYDITGALVEVLHDGSLDAGRQSIAWNAEDVASGTYFYKLTTSEGSCVRRMTLLK